MPMAAMIALAFVAHDQQVLAVALLTLAVGFNAATSLGYQVSMIYCLNISGCRLIVTGDRILNFLLIATLFNYVGKSH